MNSSSSIPIPLLRSRILRDVSRSFYLSIRLLPGPLRDSIALAYLLARATDTIADTGEMAVEFRLEQLHELAALIQGSSPETTIASFQSLASLQKNESERSLIERLPDCLAWLQSLPEEDRRDVRKVLAKINEGQALDLQRFRNPAEIVALESAADLDRYTYLVAGVVGEFWTNVCFRRLNNFTSQPRASMLKLGVDYGKGLQLINILRDLGTDVRAGRCYLPAEELASAGLTPTDLLREATRATPLLQSWRKKAEQGIAAGVEYSCSIKSRRVRLATVLPALIGARTLALLRQAGPGVFEKKIKITRGEVRRIMINAVMALASPSSLRRAHKKLLEG